MTKNQLQTTYFVYNKFIILDKCRGRRMNFLGLLLALVILVAVLYQTVFTPTVKTTQNKQSEAKVSQGLKALKQAEELKQMINKQNDNMNFNDKLNQHQ